MIRVNRSQFYQSQSCHLSKLLSPFRARYYANTVSQDAQLRKGKRSRDLFIHYILYLSYNLSSLNLDLSIDQGTSKYPCKLQGEQLLSKTFYLSNLISFVGVLFDILRMQSSASFIYLYLFITAFDSIPEQYSVIVSVKKVFIVSVYGYLHQFFNSKRYLPSKLVNY